MKKIAFVIPWYGKNISGGAETACKNIVKNLKKCNIEVEVLTTCVKDFSSDWNVNFYREGIDIIDEVIVRRFKVKKRNTKAFDKVNYKLINNLPLQKDDEDIFFDEMINSEELYSYIKVNRDNYHVFIFIPYMFGTTFFGIEACKFKSILIPCLHDENYAYMNKVKKMIESVNGVIFLSEEERKLAYSLYEIENKKNIVIGTGIDDIPGDKMEFNKKYNINNPFILYAGRKDIGKNVDVLIKNFDKFINRNKEIDLDLVLIGGGKIEIPSNIKKRVHDLGFIDINDKINAYAAAMILCQPSENESFSIVIMESWISKRPVLVSGKCMVTKNFCKLSNGGLYFSNYLEFEECLKYLLRNPLVADKMGEQGRQFVINNFSWDVVIHKYEKFVNTIYD